VRPERGEVVHNGRRAGTRGFAATYGPPLREKELSDLTKQIDKRLAPLRRELEKAERRAGSGASRMLREARRRLDEVELKGGSDFAKFLRKRRRDLSHALSELAQAVRPARKK
jgi:hypothetical protein